MKVRRGDLEMRSGGWWQADRGLSPPSLAHQAHPSFGAGPEEEHANTKYKQGSTRHFKSTFATGVVHPISLLSTTGTQCH